MIVQYLQGMQFKQGRWGESFSFQVKRVWSYHFQQACNQHWSSRVAAELTTCVCCCSRSFVSSDIHPKCLQWTKHLLVTLPWHNSAWLYARLWPAKVEPSPSPSLPAPASASPWNPMELLSLHKRSRRSPVLLPFAAMPGGERSSWERSWRWRLQVSVHLVLPFHLPWHLLQKGLRKHVSSVIFVLHPLCQGTDWSATWSPFTKQHHQVLQFCIHFHPWFKIQLSVFFPVVNALIPSRLRPLWNITLNSVTHQARSPTVQRFNTWSLKAGASNLFQLLTCY